MFETISTFENLSGKRNRVLTLIGGKDSILNRPGKFVAVDVACTNKAVSISADRFVLVAILKRNIFARIYQNCF